MGRFFTLSLFLIVMSVAAHAEYRVFLLKISKTPPPPAPGAPPPALGPDGNPIPLPESARFVESTLDPEQYVGYYPLEQGEKIVYVDTWRCFGRTDGKPHCPNPRGPAAVTAPVPDNTATAPVAPAPDQAPVPPQIQP